MIHVAIGLLIGLVIGHVATMWNLLDIIDMAHEHATQCLAHRKELLVAMLPKKRSQEVGN